MRPSRMKMISSASACTWGSWDENTKDTSCSRCMRRIRAMISAPVWLSRLAVGSSASTSRGVVARARAIATRWRWPPESCAGRLFWRSDRPTASIRACTRRRRSPAATPASASGYSTFSRALSTGIRLKFWKMKPMWRARKSDRASSGMDCTCCPATVISPWSGMSMQPIRLSRVVLPLPEGPDSTVKAPWWMSRVISLRAGTSTAPRR